MAIVVYVSDTNPDAVEALKEDIEAKVSRLRENPRLYRIGRVAGTREMVVNSNYIAVYTDDPDTVTMLRVLHAAQRWPRT